MKAIILAAGVGKRLSSAHVLPKCLLKFAGLSLLERHLQALSVAGITDVTLCLGFDSEPIIESISTSGVLVHYNPLYELGSVISLWSARQTLFSGDDVIVMDADVLYHPDILFRLVKSPARNCFVLDRDFMPGDEPVKICLRNNRIVEFRKRILPTVSYNCIGESVGFFKFDASTACRLGTIVGHYVADEKRELPHEEALRELALSDPTTIGIEDITGLPWIEIDVPDDVVRANDSILPRIDGNP